MKKFENLPKEIQIQIREVCELDPFGLSPLTLYKNVYNSTGSYVELANIFEIMPSLVKAIKES